MNFSLLSGVSFAGIMLLGPNFSSSLHTSTKVTQQSVKNAVPMEIALLRASDMIAQEEVEISALQADIPESTRSREHRHRSEAN